MTTVKTLAIFPGVEALPGDGLVADAAGDLFGITGNTIFELINTGGQFTPVTLYTLDGTSLVSMDSGLAIDAAGNLYGTAYGPDAPPPAAIDVTYPATYVAFELPRSGGGYAAAPTTQEQFNSFSPGSLTRLQPASSLLVTPSGSIVGTEADVYTFFENAKSGQRIGGAVFQIAPVAVTLSSSLDGIGTGVSPTSDLISDAAGDLFGAANYSIYEIPRIGEAYAAVPVTLAAFSFAQGQPGDLTIDTAGDLFGTTASGGTNNVGTVFEIARTSAGYAILPTLIASFTGAPSSSRGPAGGLILDAAGNIFGATGGQVPPYPLSFVRPGSGTVFEAVKTASGYASNIVTLARFGNSDGDAPAPGLVTDGAGDLFGITDGYDAAYGFTEGALSSPRTAFELSDTGFAITPTTVTVMGADSVTRTLTLGLDALAKLAAPLLAGVVPASALFVDASGAVTLTAGQSAAIVDAAGAVSLSGVAGANQTIAAGGGNFNFADSGGSGTLVAGAGNDNIALTGGGNWSVGLGNGVDSVNAAAGNNTVITGHAGSQVNLGTGSNLVVDEGNDTVVAGSGAATVSADGANDLVGGTTGTLTFIAGTGVNTVIGGTAATTLFGGASGSMLMYSNGATQYTGFGASDTIAGVAGSMTVRAGSGGGTFFGSSAGGNVMTATTGNVTAIGGGAGDVLSATGSSSNLFAGGAGAETLTGAGSTGTNTFFAGSGPETLVGGAGNTALVAGAGTDLLQGGSGVTLFLFVAGMTAGASDTVAGFDPSHDFVKLLGYGGDGSGIMPASTMSNGSATIALPDGTHIMFAEVTQFAASSFT